MWKEFRDTSAQPRIVVRECMGDLEVRGGAEQRIVLRLEGDDEDLHVEQDGDRVALAACDSCRIICPRGSVLSVGDVHGGLEIVGVEGRSEVANVYSDAKLQAVGPVTLGNTFGDLEAAGVAGDLSVGSVDGDADVRRASGAVTLSEVRGDLHAVSVPGGLTCERVDGDFAMQEGGAVAANQVAGSVDLRSVSTVQLGDVDGELNATDVAGDLHVERVRGSARVRRVAGACSVSRVDGDLRAAGLAAGMVVERVAGSVRLGPPFAPGATYRVRADGQVQVDVPPDASLKVTASAEGRVRSQVPGLELRKTDGSMAGVLGQGEAVLEIEAAGDVMLKQLDSEEEPLFEFGPDLSGLGRQIEEQVARAMEGMEVQLAQSLGRFDSEGFGKQAAQAAGRAAEHVRQQAEHAAEKARLRAEQAERRWQRASGQRARPREEKTTDEERLRVLRMVEAGKLSPQEAADLLAALEGR